MFLCTCGLDIHGVGEVTHSMNVGVISNNSFRYFRTSSLEHFELKLLLLSDIVKYPVVFPVILKYVSLNDIEMLFSVEICFLHQVGKDNSRNIWFCLWV